MRIHTHRTCARRRTWAMVLVVATGVVLSVGLSPAAMSAPAAPLATDAASPTDQITWAVDPADSAGPDGRAWVELELDPGQTVTEHIAVRNLSTIDATFALSAADAYFTDAGRFTMLSSSESSTKAGRWVAVAESVDVPAGATVVVPYTVTVPSNTTPGDHAAGVAASITMVGDTPDGGGTLGVESRVGFRVITRVTGDLQPSLTVTDVRSSYAATWNPVAGGSMDVEADVVNDGNVTLVVTGQATAGGGQAELAYASGSPTVEILPGAEVTITTRLDPVWPLGPVETDVHLTGVAEGVTPIRADGSVSTWTAPWPQMALLAGLALLVVALRADRRRRRDRLARMLQEARASGLADAAREPGPAGTRA